MHPKTRTLPARQDPQGRDRRRRRDRQHRRVIESLMGRKPELRFQYIRKTPSSPATSTFRRRRRSPMSGAVPKTMRVVEAAGLAIDRLKLVERPVPEPRRGEILVRLAAATLNYRASRS